MKRDMNLIREILVWTESQEHGFAWGDPQIEGYSSEQIGYHIHLMEDAGLVTAVDITSASDKSPRALLTGLTWKGHEFVSASHDDTIWAKAKTTLLKTTTSITFDILIEWLKAEARNKLGYH